MTPSIRTLLDITSHLFTLQEEKRRKCVNDLHDDAG